MVDFKKLLQQRKDNRMGLTATAGNNVEFELCPADTYRARSYAIIDLGTQTKNYKGEDKRIHEIVIIWELEEKMKDGRPFVLSNTYNLSLNSGANLRADLEAWRGRPFTDEELKGFNVNNVLGAPCFIGVTHYKDKQDRDKAQIGSITKPPKGTPVLDSVNDPLIFDLDAFDQEVFDSLPKWIQDKIKLSPEYQALTVKTGPIDFKKDAIDTEADIPF